MIKCVVFDLDDTLAPIGKGADDYTLKALKKLEEKGMQIVLSSGKPSFYLCGFCRQLELNDPILIGENGGVIQFGIDLPPRFFEINEGKKGTAEKLMKLKKGIKEELPFNIWFQPDEVGLTSFFKTEEEKKALREFYVKNICSEDDLTVYEHADSFDVTPNGITKKSSLTRVQELLGLKKEEVVAIGNGVNDYPMFEAAGYSIAIGEHPKDAATVIVDSIHSAMDILMKWTED